VEALPFGGRGLKPLGEQLTHGHPPVRSRRGHRPFRAGVPPARRAGPGACPGALEAQEQEPQEARWAGGPVRGGGPHHAPDLPRDSPVAGGG
jgi:hypothetical protein